MKRAFGLVLLAAALVAVVVSVGVGRPSRWGAAAEAEIDSTPEIVASYLKDLKRWPRWAPWVVGEKTARRFEVEGGRRLLYFSGGPVRAWPEGALVLLDNDLGDGGGVLGFELRGPPTAVSPSGETQTGEVQVREGRPVQLRLVLTGEVWGDAGAAHGQAKQQIEAAVQALRRVSEADAAAADVASEADRLRAEAAKVAREHADPAAPPPAPPATAEQAQKAAVLKRVTGGL